MHTNRPSWLICASYSLVAIFLLASCASTRQLLPMKISSSTLHVIDSLCQNQLHESHLPGLAIAIAHEGKWLWTAGYGYSDLETKTAVDADDDLFRIGSISKTITASALARLMQKDKIDLDVPISTYYPGFTSPVSDITLRQLGGHLAGIRHYRGSEFMSNIRYESPKDALEVFIHDDLLFDPGTKYSYTTYGWTLLSAVMSEAVDQEFLSIIREEVAKPLALADLKPDHPDSIHYDRVSFYEWYEGNAIESPDVDNSNKWAGGGFLCTADDLARFGTAMASPGFLKKETLEEFTTPQKLPDGESTHYGIGVGIGTDSEGRLWYGHSGGSVGGTSMMLIYPDEKLVVVTLVNMGRAEMDKLAWKIAQVVREDDFSPQ